MKDLKEAMKDKKAIIGTKLALKTLRNGQAKIIFLAKNCPRTTQQTIERYAQLTETEVIHLDIDNDQVGISAKKPYSISVVAIKK